jgi:hypothetical protein
MKKLILPLVIAVFAGLSGGSGFSYMNAKKAAAVVTAHAADSIAKHVHDSTAVADSLDKVEHARQLAEAAAAATPLTPADSIRAAQNQPTTLAAATHGVPNAVDPKHPAATPNTPPKTNSHAAVEPSPSTVSPSGSTSGSSSKSVATSEKKPEAVKTTTAPAPTTPALRVEPAVPAPVENALPERRISKIFGAMQSKDAAKVLEQMTDSDIRTILGMMGDKQAAAILSAMPATRAAAISKGEMSKNSALKDDKKPTGGRP